MIGFKTVFKLIFGLIFVTLLILFFVLVGKDYKKCTLDNPCIRFCSKNRSSKSALNLLEDFKDKNLLKSQSYLEIADGMRVEKSLNLSQYNVLFGEPECIDKISNSPFNYIHMVRLKFIFIKSFNIFFVIRLMEE